MECWPSIRLLLDENLPIALAAELADHDVSTISGLGWAGARNGEPLNRMEGRFDALITLDSNMERQQVIRDRPFALLVVHCRSNRLADLLPLVPDILDALNGVSAADVRTIGMA